MNYLTTHRPLVALCVVTAFLTLLPTVLAHVALGDAWRGFMPSFADEPAYSAHVENIVEGYFNDGNPYFLEHRGDYPLVLFAGAWVNALPRFAGLSFNDAMFLNFVVFSLVFVLLVYALLRRCTVAPWLSAAGSLFLYLDCFWHIYRTVNLQTVYPVYLLFLIGLFAFVRTQNRASILMLIPAIALSFYVFSYLWQAIVIILGLFFLYALVRKDWELARSTFLTSFAGGLLGLPSLIYMLWLSKESPYFWESISRFGLVHSHLPMFEVVTSGGWIGVVLLLIGYLLYRSPALRSDSFFQSFSLYLAVSGLGLWIMQGSNLITGKLLETGEHVKHLIIPWLLLTTIALGSYLVTRRRDLPRPARYVALLGVGVLSLASLFYAYTDFTAFVPKFKDTTLWHTQQLYHGPFEWLTEHEPTPVVVWSNPHNDLSPNLPTFTRHYELFASYGMWELVPTGEFNERYLVSQYFDRPTVDDLKADLVTYLGRQYLHAPKTAERATKICRILFMWDKGHDCGAVQTPAEAAGDPLFEGLETKFTTDIRPHIKDYLKKYHVSYILKDLVTDPQYHPEELGAVLVYRDSRYELYKLP